MIEAMARDLPYIGSNAGGIPELLPAKDIALPGDVQANEAIRRSIMSISSHFNPQIDLFENT